MQKKYNIRKICVTSIMAALAAVMMFLEFSVPIMPWFLKFDFSELPALITSFAFGPLWGVLVCLIKNLVKLFNTQTAGIGELANFILGAVFVFISGTVYKKNKSKKSAVIGTVIGAVAMAAISFPVNYYVVYPVYEKFMSLEDIIKAYNDILPSIKNLAQSLIIFNIPFTLAKGMINAVITFIIYKKISPVLKGKSI